MAIKTQQRQGLLAVLSTRFARNMRRHAGVGWPDVQPRLEADPAALLSGQCLLEMASEMGLDLLTEAQYRALQPLGEFGTKTSSWIATPADIRALGGALFCDRRYGQVFTYHNGVQSYYAVRGFRGARQV